MVILHGFLALVAGFATIVVLVALPTMLFKQIARHRAEDSDKNALGHFLAGLGGTLVASAAGGYVTAWLADSNTLDHVLALATVVLVLAALSALDARGRQPLWQQLVLVALIPAGVVAGGLLRLLVLGVL